MSDQNRPNVTAQGARISPRAPRPGVVSRHPASGGRLPRDFGRLAAVCAAIIAAGLALQALMPGGFPVKSGAASRPAVAMVSEIHGGGPVRINEIMTSNSGALVDDAGETPDWIEIANIGGRPVNLRGYALARSAKAGNVFVFPELLLQAGECAVVYADGRLAAEAGQELHAPFRLSAEGDVLMLFNDADVAVDTVNIPALAANTAYVRRDRNTWAADARITPGMLNDGQPAASDIGVRIVEVVASNTRYAPDENGLFHDYIVLRNDSASDADIGGWYLSDDPQLPRLWRFPQGAVLPAGGTLRVYASGQNRRDDVNDLHAGFRLSTEGETITLSDAAGLSVDSVTYDLLKTDVAYVRGDDGVWSVGVPVE